MLQKNIGYLFIWITYSLIGGGAVVAQETIVLEGFISDSIQPLSNVNVIARPKSAEETLVFSITDPKGQYELALTQGAVYAITVSALGYTAYSFEWEAKADTKKNIQLSQATEQLEEVIIVEEVPMIVKKDTIIYDTKAFTTGNEYKLKNILEKLPGVAVERNGDVLVNGKKVTKMLVEGSPFFGGSNKLAVENIPANAVDNVEVLDHYTEVSFLKDYVDSDEMAMNITLKEDKKRFVFGDLEGGYGIDNRHASHAGVFYYSPTTNMNFIGDVNDTGYQSFTFRDYMNFEGGRSRLSDMDGLSRADIIQNYNYLINNEPVFSHQHAFAAFNATATLNKSLSIAGYGIVLRNDTESNRETLTNFFLEEDSYQEENQVQRSVADVATIHKLAVDYAPSGTEQLFFDAQLKIADHQLRQNRFATIGTISNDILHEEDLRDLEWKQNLEWHKRYNAKHTVSFIAENVYGRVRPNRFWDTDRPIVPSVLDVVPQSRFVHKQEERLEQHTFDAVGKHYWVLNATNHLYTTLGMHYESQVYDTNTYQELSDGNRYSFADAGFGNALRWVMRNPFLAVHYKTKIGALTLKTGGYLQQYDWSVNQQSSVSDNRLVVLPDMTAKIELDESEYLSFRYRFASNFADAPAYANRLRLLDYNSTSSGNETLTNELYQRGMLRYVKLAMYKGLIFNAQLGYTRKTSYVREQIAINGIDQLRTMTQLDTPETAITVGMNLRKRIKKLDAKVYARFRYANFQKIIQGINQQDEQYDYNATMSVASRFKKIPNFTVGSHVSLSSYHTTDLTTTFVNINPYARMEYSFLKEFIVKCEYDWTRFRNTTLGVSSVFDKASASLLYRVDNSPFGFEISATNLFDTTFQQQNNASAFLVSDQRDFIIPRIILFSMHYKL